MADPEVVDDQITETPLETGVVAPDVPVQDAALETAAPAISPYLQKLTESGFQGVKDEAEGFDRLFDAYQQTNQKFESTQKQLAELQAKAVLAEQLQQQLADPAYVQWKQQQAAPPAAPSNWWDRPAVDQTLLSHFQSVDAEGNSTLKPETPLELRAQIERQRAWDQKWAQDLVHNGDQAFHKGVLGTLKAHPEILKELLAPYLQEQLQQRETQSAADAYLSDMERQNAAWLYAKNPLSGEPQIGAFTEAGTKFSTYFNDALERTNDVQFAWKTAMAYLTAEQGDPRAKQTKETIQNGRDNFLKRNNGIPQLNGSQLPDEHNLPQNKHLSPGRDFLAAYRDG